MSDTNPNRAAVRRPNLKGKSPAQCINVVETICNSAEQCAEVQASPVAAPALAALKGALATTQLSLASRLALAQALLAAIKALGIDMCRLKGALGTFAAAIGGLAGGDASVITRAGLLTRDPRGAGEALGQVSGLTSKPGKQLREAIVSWPAAPGAKSYALEINVSGDPTGPTTALRSGTRRRRVIVAPAAGGQVLVRVAGLAGDGTPSEWSDWILATAR
jgi:hypothetical protein